MPAILHLPDEVFNNVLELSGRSLIFSMVSKEVPKRIAKSKEAKIRLSINIKTKMTANLLCNFCRLAETFEVTVKGNPKYDDIRLCVDENVDLLKRSIFLACIQRIVFWKIEKEMAMKVCTVLSKCSSLAYLDLSLNRIGIEGARRLAQELGQCSLLAHLEFRGNNIGDEGLGSLGAVLPRLPSLAELNLGYNFIGDAGLRGFAAVLPRCSSLTRLNLCCNFIEDYGAGSLAAVLPQCQALFLLDLHGNRISAEGAAALGQCPSLAHLNLCDNLIGD